MATGTGIITAGSEIAMAIPCSARRTDPDSAALALAGLAIFAFAHIVFVAIGAVVLGILYFGHRHGFDFSPNANPGGPRTPSN